VVTNWDHLKQQSTTDFLNIDPESPETYPQKSEGKNNGQGFPQKSEETSLNPPLTFSTSNE
jgi:hypothetical protein